MSWTAIIAIDGNGVIGIDNKLPWDIKEELEHFKRTTINKNLLMGRKTYESLPNTFNNRHVYILTKNFNYVPTKKNCTTTVIHNWNQLTNKDLIICGGLEVYKQLLNRCDTLIISLIKANYNGNKILKINLDDYKLIKLECRKEFNILTFKKC